MLVGLRTYRNSRVQTRDGAWARVRDFRFLDDVWRIERLVVELESASDGYCRLAPLSAIARVNRRDSVLHFWISERQLRDLPRVRVDENIGLSPWAVAPEFTSWAVALDFGTNAEPLPASEIESAFLEHEYVFNEIEGAKIVTPTHQFGSVDDLIIDDSTWRIRYVLIGTRRWLPARSVVIEPRHIDKLDPYTRSVHTTLSKEQILGCPSVNPYKPLEPELEIQVRTHYASSRKKAA